jgi:hypothetical protein
MNFDTAVISSIIALTGVVISVFITYVTTRLTIRSEINKIETSIIQNYSLKILEERNKRYPEIYFELSHFSKLLYSYTLDIGREKVDINAFQVFVNNMDEINSKHSVFFSSATGSVSHRLRMSCYSILNEVIIKKQEFDKTLKTFNIETLLEQIANLEISLKKDLGIFIIEFQDAQNRTSAMSIKDLRLLRKKLHNEPAS